MNDNRDDNMDASEEEGGQLTSDTPTAVPCEIKDFMQRLASDRLIKIIVGEGSERQQFLVQETVLTASSDYFQKAIEHERTMGDVNEIGVLSFPEDGHLIAAWGLMLHWIIHHRLLPIKRTRAENLVLYTEAWVLGDKHLLPKFQNVVMMELIHYLDDVYHPSHKPEVMRSLLSIAPANSPIQRLWAEEAVLAIYGNLVRSPSMVPDDLVGLEVVTGMIGSLLNAFEAVKNGKDFWRLDTYFDDHDEERSKCEEYLVPQSAADTNFTGAEKK
ncbi:hypothetical protein PRZ48_006220 [Zasmidium cellare]|uniref:BTB domain-containing protein n=1 Tax=Zasmidium cellare TaxID=395010 RepID=A0ABR0EMK0_ZASCE|nr:hypothetical protein PRZ48_006220 [Zasmidium cellare]